VYSLRKTVLLLIIALLLASPVLVSAESTLFKVPAGGYYPVTVSMNSGDRLDYSFQVSSWRGTDEIAFSIRDPNGNSVVSLGRVGGYSGSYTASSSGSYTMYFDNGFSIITEKDVSLNYGVTPAPIPGVLSAPTLGSITSLAWILVVLAVIAMVVGIAKVASGSGRSSTSAAVSITQNRFCRYCGSRVGDGVFCPSCGRSLA
jgi:hypothetical protein